MRVLIRLLALPLIIGLVSAQDFRIPTDLMLSGVSEPVEKIIYIYQKYDTDHQKFKVFET